jgi:hypothetical protein
MTHAIDVALVPFVPKEGGNWRLSPHGVQVTFALNHSVHPQWMQIHFEPALIRLKHSNRTPEIQQLEIKLQQDQAQVVGLLVETQVAHIQAVHEVLKGLLIAANQSAQDANAATLRAQETSVAHQTRAREQALEAFKKLT